MLKYVTLVNEPWMPIGATKAKEDFAKIANQNNWQIINIDRAEETVDISKLEKDDILIHQFPSYLSAEWENKLADEIKKINAKLVYLIHDIEPFRMKRDNPWEFQLFKKADLLIVHNPIMKNRLNNESVDTPMISIGFFDYLTEEKANKHQFETIINYAGTLSKANFLLDKFTNFPINVYGGKPKKWPDTLPENINYQGAFKPEELPSKLSDGFGLLWDDEPYHQYEIINTPHKLSLYLAAGLPVIIWSKAAMTPAIKQQRLGFTIDVLSDLDKIILNSDEYEYQNLLTNVEKIGQKIRNGDYSKLVLQRVEDYFQ